MLVGAYHYARPASSTGAVQARHFVAVGGPWSPDGRTLPGALDLERSEGADPCHGRTAAELVAWVREFSATYQALTGRVPVIYVRTDMWQRCLGDDRGIGAGHPLWLFDHEGGPGPWPSGWARPTIWQRGVERGIDRNVWFGTEAALRAFADG
jgi:GH25 family lysozyme M1 (1,4-beta-N-acetylmuramidase)